MIFLEVVVSSRILNLDIPSDLNRSSSSLSRRWRADVFLRAPYDVTALTHQTQIYYL